ncbi:MAG: RIP metalloprotease RseP [bacterium]
MFLTIIIFIIILSILVFAHEFGHFVTARKFGAKCDEFGFGFPPRAFGIYKKNNNKWSTVIGKKEVNDAVSTIYSINWIPLGGFVKIKGENGENKQDKDSFASKPIWQRGIILSAGVSMNVLLAAVIISIGMMIGIPQILDGVKPQAEISDRKIQIVRVFPDTPAALADVKIGDVIMSIDGQEFINDDELADYVNKHTGEELTYALSSRGQEVTRQITPELMESTDKGGIGVAIAEIGKVKYPWHIALYEGIKITFLMLWAIIIGIIGIISSLLAGQGAGGEVAGPVGIAVLTGQMMDMGFVYLMQFTAILSLNLAILNFLPIPALDGGRMLFLIIEKIKGRPVKKEVEASIHNIGFILLMLLVAFVTFKDVARIGCWTCKIKEWFNLIT